MARGLYKIYSTTLKTFWWIFSFWDCLIQTQTVNVLILKEFVFFGSIMAVMMSVWSLMCPAFQTLCPVFLVPDGRGLVRSSLPYCGSWPSISVVIFKQTTRVTKHQKPDENEPLLHLLSVSRPLRNDNYGLHRNRLCILAKLSALCLFPCLIFANDWKPTLHPDGPDWDKFNDVWVRSI